MDSDWSACLQTLVGHRDSVTSVAWSQDAAWLASASSDMTVKIWDTATGWCISTFEVSHTVRDLQFDRSISYLLHTNIGTFDLRNTTSSTFSATASPYSLASSPQTVGYSLNDENWLEYNGKRLLWLPTEYRPSSSALSGRLLGVGCRSGRVLLFTFSEADPLSQQ